MNASILLLVWTFNANGSTLSNLWGDFVLAFPAFPCPDGWSGCVVWDDRLDPGWRGDPADQRITWFELSPTAAFSPFVGLSEYEETSRAFVDMPPPVPPPTDAPPHRPRTRRLRRAPTYEYDGKTDHPLFEPAAALEGAELCLDLLPLESKALLGRLSAEEIGCLESRASKDAKMTDREKASLVLLANAWASDRSKWEPLVRRHLEEIDRSDPNIAYKYAVYLSKLGPSRSLGVLRWSAVALENRSIWEGDDFPTRVNALHRMRATAYHRLWEEAEKAHAQEPTRETREKTEEYRNLAKVHARERFEYAKKAGKDASTALAMCKAAAGIDTYCSG